MLIALTCMLFVLEGEEFTVFRQAIAGILFGVAICQMGFGQALTKIWSELSHQTYIGTLVAVLVTIIAVAYTHFWPPGQFANGLGPVLFATCLCLMAWSAVRAGVLQNTSQSNRMLVFQNFPKTLLFVCSPFVLISYNAWIAASSFFVLLLLAFEFFSKLRSRQSLESAEIAPALSGFRTQVVVLFRATAAPAVILMSTVIGQHFEFLTSSLAEQEIGDFEIGFSRVSLIFSFLASLMFFLQNKAVSETVERTLTTRSVVTYTGAAILVVVLIFATLFGAAQVVPALSAALYLDAAPMAFTLVFLKSGIWCTYFISGALLYYLGFNKISVLLGILPLIYAALPLTGLFDFPSMQNASIALICLMLVSSVISNVLIAGVLKGNAFENVKN